MSDIETVSSGSNGAQEFDFDPDSLRAKYREERDKRIRPDGNEQYVEVKGDFSRYIDDPYVDPGFTRAPLNDAVDVVIIGGGFGGLLAGARLREAGREGYPHHRERRRLRRHLVLEPLSRRAMRYRVVHLSAAARGDRLHPEGEVLVRAGNPRARAAHRREVRSVSRRVLSDADQGDHLERGRVPVDRHDRSRRPHARALRRHVQRPAEPAEAARHSRHRQLQGPHLPHQPLGLRLHGRRYQRKSAQARRQARRRYRHRRDRRPMRAASRASTRSICTCSSARRRRSTSAATGRPTPNG